MKESQVWFAFLSIFWVLLVKVRRKEKKSRYETYMYGTLVWNSCMETCLGLCMESMEPICMELLRGTLVWNTCMELCMDLLVRKPS